MLMIPHMRPVFKISTNEQQRCLHRNNLHIKCQSLQLFEVDSSSGKRRREVIAQDRHTTTYLSSRVSGACLCPASSARTSPPERPRSAQPSAFACLQCTPNLLQIQQRVSVQLHWATSNVCNSDSDQVSRCCCECF